MRGASRLVFAAILTSAGGLCAGGAVAASFDCKAAKGRIEQLICKTPDLDSLDSQLQGAYLGALDRSRRPGKVKEQQQAWLRQRDACADAACMTAAYEQQIGTLQGISDDPPDCAGGTTIQIDSCLAEYAHRADRQLARYIAAVRKRLTDEAKENPDSKASVEALTRFDQSQAAWIAFRKAECEAVYAWYSEGTIRGAMYGGCMSALTDLRTRDIWTTWLQFMDSTPPLMPDPVKTVR